MKAIHKCVTTWAAVSLPLIGWAIQWKSGGVLPMFVQTWGPLLIGVGVVLLRRGTSEACHFCGNKK